MIKLVKLGITSAIEPLQEIIKGAGWDLEYREIFFNSKKDYSDFIQECIAIGAWEKFAPDKFMIMFWNLIDTSKKRSKNDIRLQRKLIKEQLKKEWSFEDIWLFRSVVITLRRIIEKNKYLEEEYDDKFYYLKGGIIGLGRDVFKDAVFKSEQFVKNLNSKVYIETLEAVENDEINLYSVALEIYCEKYFDTDDPIQIENWINGGYEYTEFILNFEEMEKELKNYLNIKFMSK